MKSKLLALSLLPLCLSLSCCDSVNKGDYSNRQCIFEFVNKETNMCDQKPYSCYLTKGDTLAYVYFYFIEHDFLGYWEIQYQKDKNSNPKGGIGGYPLDTFDEKVMTYSYDNYYLKLNDLDNHTFETIDKRG